MIFTQALLFKHGYVMVNLKHLGINVSKRFFVHTRSIYLKKIVDVWIKAFRIEKKVVLFRVFCFTLLCNHHTFVRFSFDRYLKQI